VPELSQRQMGDDGYSDSLRTLLRNATKDAHHRIDHHPLVAPLVRHGLTAAQYGNALLALFALHAPLEKAFSTFLSIPEYSPPPRSSLLAEDLSSLGRQADLTNLPLALLWSGHGIATPSEYVGMRYVIEGSAMGAKFIRAQLKTTLPEGCRTITRFFDGYPGDGDWRALWQFAATQGSFNHVDAAAAAIRLFTDIEDLFDRHFELYCRPETAL